jgi:Glu-tRNA(Gln) amidotransferase subunit E-like FAD-binding protein
MSDFGVRFETVPLMCDNTSAISVAKNTVFHKKMRHGERRHHFLRDHVEKEDIEMRYCHTRFLRPKPDAHRMYAQDQVVIHTARM